MEKILENMQFLTKNLFLLRAEWKIEIITCIGYNGPKLGKFSIILSKKLDYNIVKFKKISKCD